MTSGTTVTDRLPHCKQVSRLFSNDKLWVNRDLGCWWHPLDCFRPLEKKAFNSGPYRTRLNSLLYIRKLGGLTALPNELWATDVHWTNKAILFLTLFIQESSRKHDLPDILILQKYFKHKLILVHRKIQLFIVMHRFALKLVLSMKQVTVSTEVLAQLKLVVIMKKNPKKPIHWPENQPFCKYWVSWQ